MTRAERLLLRLPRRLRHLLFPRWSRQLELRAVVRVTDELFTDYSAISDYINARP